MKLRVSGLGFGVWGVLEGTWPRRGCGVQSADVGNHMSLRNADLRAGGSGWRKHVVSGVGFRVQGLGFRVSGLGFRILGVRFRV